MFSVTNTGFHLPSARRHLPRARRLAATGPWRDVVIGLGLAAIGLVLILLATSAGAYLDTTTGTGALAGVDPALLTAGVLPSP